MEQLLRKQDYMPDGEFPFVVQRYNIRKGTEIPSHAHDFYELVYVVSGSATHEMADHRYALRPGDVFILEPHASHRYEASPHEDTIVYNVLFDTAFLQREIETLLRLPGFVDFFYLAPFHRASASFVPFIRLDELQSGLLLDSLKRMETELAERQAGYPLLVKNRWIECLIMLSRFHRDGTSGNRPELSDRERIESIRHLIETNYTRSFSLEQLSKLCGMSVSSFTAKFKDATGMSMLEYKQSVQIRHACRLLETTDDKVVAIALETGFDDISFFNRTFRKIKGRTPKDYRRRPSDSDSL
ncbi:helix-turn-helix domain-containing protein [Cohnella sp. GCM10027633]|uniref:helix-turn-helix domain-containing protein n=1 Tax=unclassified Cohnella TaxID=2636738 RepID=UPI003624E11B